VGEHIAELEKGIQSLHKAVRIFAEDESYAELIRIIRQPGWTTPAEFALVLASVEAMNAHVHELTKFKTSLVAAAKEVAGERVEAGVA
jgi:hypothetical protein